MSEYISREELLKAVDTWDKFGCDANTKLVPVKDCYVPYVHYDDIVHCIKGMPSADVRENVHGEWIREDIHSSWKCSKCNTYAIEDFEHCEIRSPFCPNCGADMRGE